ncbi:MAG: sigma-70 family RNA polymerase sigma factor [Prevotella sp.]|nr:sigma-70 family RNA polymerase sigma factor [Prevotella sp.]
MRQFYDRYGDALAAVCARYIADEDDVKDVFQDSLVSIFTHVGGFSYRGVGSLLAWATKIAVNESLRFLKTKKHYELQRLTEDPPETPEPEADDPPIDDVPPEVIHQMVTLLPTGYRTVLNLFVFEGRSHKEIGQLLDIGEKTSASQLCRAKNLLAKMILDYHNHKRLTP